MKTEILNTDEESAIFVTGVEGWTDRHGRFWGKDESAARWSGCTHIACSGCGKPTSKNYTACPDCRNKKSIERYNGKEKVEWDNKTPLYSESADCFFFDCEDLNNYLEEIDCNAEHLRLVICEPIKLSPISTDFWEDELSEDGELPEEILKALDEFNMLIGEQAPSSWMPGKYAATIQHYRSMTWIYKKHLSQRGRQEESIKRGM